MIPFIEQAKNASFELRICAYEFKYEPVLKAFKAAKNRGATVRIIYDAGKANPGDNNDAAVANVGIKSLCIRRTTNPSYISHNKFIVLLKNGNPECVWTGGTNFSEGGIFGHSNAGHVVEETSVAEAFNEYWQLLSNDPQRADLSADLEDKLTIPEGKPKKGATAIFSPRSDTAALEWYAKLAAGAQMGLFATFAFGMHDLLQDVYRTSTAPMRYALLDKATRPIKKGPLRDAAEAKIRQLRALPENRFAIGAHLTLNNFDRWVAERNSGLNHNVQYVHTKYMLVDPLSDDPIVVAGSANFSDASSNENDENMIVTRGNKRVADIYLGEFMRLYNHYAFREWAAKKKEEEEDLRFKFLRTDAWWEAYFGDTEKSHQRQYFVS